MNQFVPGARKVSGSARLLLSLTGLMGACAATQPPRPPQFPSPEALAALAAQPVQESSGAPSVKSVDEWKLTGPFLDASASPAPPASPSVQRLLTQAASVRAGAAVAASAAAACTAREVALFRAAHAGPPPEALLRFMAGRCGLVGPEIAAACQSVPRADGADADDEQTIERNAPALRMAVGDTLARVAAPQMEAGVAVNREPTEPLFCWVVAARVVQVASMALIPDGNNMVTVEVTLPEETVRFEALVTVGRLGVRACTTRADVALPQVRLACPVDRSDTAAWIDISATEVDRVVGQRVFSALVWPAGVPGDTYRSTGANTAAGSVSCAPVGPVSPGDGVALCLNQLRGTRGLSPLKLAIEQSRTAEPLARHLFARLAGAASAPGREEADLGLRAGWNVKAEVRADVLLGQLAHVTQPGAAEPAALLGALLERPLERAVLLDPQAGAMAVAVVPAGNGSTGAAVSTYRLLREGARNQDADVNEVLDHLNALRVANNLTAATIFENGQWRTRYGAQQVTLGKWSAKRAIDDACENAAEKVKFSHIHVWMSESPSPGTVPIPPQLLKMAQLELAIGVALAHDGGEPWVRHQVFFVVLHETRDNWGADSGAICTPTISNLPK